MRAGRLLSILLLLQVHRRVTARDLAKRLEVSERTILRDMDALSISGIPVTAERGTGGRMESVGGISDEAHGTQRAGNPAAVSGAAIGIDGGPRHQKRIGSGADQAAGFLAARVEAAS